MRIHLRPDLGIQSQLLCTTLPIVIGGNARQSGQRTIPGKDLRYQTDLNGASRQNPLLERRNKCEIYGPGKGQKEQIVKYDQLRTNLEVTKSASESLRNGYGALPPPWLGKL